MLREALGLLAVGGTLIGVAAFRSSKGKKKKRKRIDPEKRLDAVWDDYSGTLKEGAKEQVEDFFEEYIDERDGDFETSAMAMAAAEDLVPMYHWERERSQRAEEILLEINSLAIGAED